MDHVAVCKAFYSATGIPVVLMRTRDSDSSNPFEGIGEMLFSSSEFFSGIPAEKEYVTFKGDRSPVFCGGSENFEYGLVRILGTDLSIIIGPMFSVPVTDEMARKYVLETHTPIQYLEKVTEILRSTPLVSHARYAWLLAFLDMVVNRRDFEPAELYDLDNEQSELLQERSVAERMEQLENESRHIDYETEQQLYAIVREGSIAKLDQFFAVSVGSFNEGKLAANPLRHAKNLFITAISKLVILSAIPGGMNAEQAHQLMDTYIQEVEQQRTVEAVHMLQYSMFRDITLRIGRSKLPEDISPEIHAAVEYIRCHVNAPITNADIAEHLGRSVSYVTHRFKEETGVSIGEYAMQCRLEEAVSLLRHSSKSLAEIASYLCFSNQSYFQNVFKKKYGITPMQFRRQKK